MLPVKLMLTAKLASTVNKDLCIHIRVCTRSYAVKVMQGGLYLTRHVCLVSTFPFCDSVSFSVISLNALSSFGITCIHVQRVSRHVILILAVYPTTLGPRHDYSEGPAPICTKTNTPSFDVYTAAVCIYNWKTHIGIMISETSRREENLLSLSPIPWLI